jgi:hypothetical protein
MAPLNMTENLSSVKEDMIAFVEGHGMKRYPGYVSDEVASINWESGDNADSWKDFVELAKAAGASFLTMNDMVLEKEELEFLIDRLRNANVPNDEDIEEARLLRTYIGKTGFVQLGWAHQGMMFVYEASTEWYERYQRLLDLAEDFGSIVIDDSEDED